MSELFEKTKKEILEKAKEKKIKLDKIEQMNKETDELCKELNVSLYYNPRFGQYAVLDNSVKSWWKMFIGKNIIYISRNNVEDIYYTLVRIKTERETK